MTVTQRGTINIPPFLTLDASLQASARRIAPQA